MVPLILGNPHITRGRRSSVQGEARKHRPQSSGLSALKCPELNEAQLPTMTRGHAPEMKPRSLGHYLANGLGCRVLGLGVTVRV